MRTGLKIILGPFLFGVLSYFNIDRWHNPFLGWVILIAYLIFCASGAYAVLVKFFNLPADKTRTRVLAIFFSLSTLGLFLGGALLFFRFNELVISVTLFLHALISATLKKWAVGAKNLEAVKENGEESEKWEIWKGGILLLPIYFALVAYGFYLLIVSRSGESLLTPWQTIHPAYIYVFTFATLLLGLAVFSKIKVRTVVLLLVVHSFLLHSYLPLTHNLLYGADQWRHMAAENRLIDETSPRPLLERRGNESEAGQSLIEKMNLNEWSYSQLWGTSVFISRLTSSDIISVNRWFLPIVWSVIFPLLLFEFLQSLGLNRRLSLAGVWFSFLFFALQAVGSFTLPVGWGFLWWLLLMILILKRAKGPRWEQTAVLGALGALSIFGYVLFFILFWAGWAIYWILNIKYWKLMPVAVVIGASVLFMLVIPGVELAARYSYIDKGIDIKAQAKQLFGNLSAWYLADGPRPHDIATGNIIFNQTPMSAFVANAFTEDRGWLIVAAGLVLALSLLGLFASVKKREVGMVWLSIFSLGVWGSYVISRYMLKGENILSRRLDVVLALTLTALSLVAVKEICAEFAKRKWNGPIKKIFLFISFVFITVAISASYSLGPDARALSQDEFSAMEFVWSKEKNNQNPCVLADTYPLLALETLSRGKIVGGSFPMGQYFVQPERVELYKKMTANPAPELWSKAKELTKAEYCYLVTSETMIGGQDLEKVGEFGKIGIFRKI